MPCQCQTAVIRAYTELRQRGQTEGDSYSASVRVYRHFHPEVDRIRALEAVADWIDGYETGGLPASNA